MFTSAKGLKKGLKRVLAINNGKNRSRIIILKKSDTAEIKMNESSMPIGHSTSLSAELELARLSGLYWLRAVQWSTIRAVFERRLRWITPEHADHPNRWIIDALTVTSAVICSFTNRSFRNLEKGNFENLEIREFFEEAESTYFCCSSPNINLMLIL